MLDFLCDIFQSDALFPLFRSQVIERRFSLFQIQIKISKRYTRTIISATVVYNITTKPFFSLSFKHSSHQTPQRLTNDPGSRIVLHTSETP